MNNIDRMIKELDLAIEAARQEERPGHSPTYQLGYIEGLRQARRYALRIEVKREPADRASAIVQPPAVLEAIVKKNCMPTIKYDGLLEEAREVVLSGKYPAEACDRANKLLTRIKTERENLRTPCAIVDRTLFKRQVKREALRIADQRQSQ